ncbi:MAG: NAD(P)/FAD-dependent oxidoreductase [Psychrobacillus sp.]
MYDCIIIGGGPAGLGASLTLGRARRKIALFDDGTNRNRVTHESHGFITRDGIKPHEFKGIGLSELKNYPNVSYFNKTIIEVRREKEEGNFIVKTRDNHEYISEKILLATGIQEMFPIESIRKFYGKNLFSCPYCDGWELRDKPLLILAEKEEHILHMVKLIYNWSNDLMVLTNGNNLSEEGMRELAKHNIEIKNDRIEELVGEEGYLKEVRLVSGEIINRNMGFVAPTYYRPNYFAEKLGCEIDEKGRVMTDPRCRTTQKNVYVAGESRKPIPSSLMIAAADGNKAAVSINTDLTEERF